MWAEVVTAVAAMLGIVGGMLRYLLKVTASVESTAALNREHAAAFTQHVEQSAKLHEALTDRVALHDTEIAVLRTRLGMEPAP